MSSTQLGEQSSLISHSRQTFVCGGFHQHPRVKSLHPPVDSILLRGMVANGFGNADDFEGIHWTKLNSSGYQKVIDAIRSATKTGPLWEVEKFWRS